MSNTVPINLKAPLAIREMLDKAAKALHRNRTDFMLEASVERAKEVLMDQRVIEIDDAQFEAFVKALDTPPASNPRLESLLSRKAPWE